MLMILFYLMMLLILLILNFDVWLILNFGFFFFFFIFTFNLMGFFIFNISMLFGLDMCSYGLILLSFWICLLNMLVSMNYFNFNIFYLINNFILLMILFLMFTNLNLFYFYILFESSLFPIILMIIGWGVQVDRIQAGIYLLFYTLMFSLPMLICIMKINFIVGILFFNLILNINFFFYYLILTMTFLVKMPMYFIHLWLLKAHTEAPLGGSMILAGILLKMGGYGLIRVMKFMIFMNLKFNIFWIIISLIGGVYMSIMCIIQLDMKLLIACSSIVHMSLVISGLLSMSMLGFKGSYILMIGHGLSSSGLFILANCYYNLILSRSLMINKGMLSMFPILSLWWFLLLTSNMATPPSLNLLGEISLFSSILNWSLLNLMLIILMSFFSVVYSLYLFIFSQYGNYMSGLIYFLIGNYKDYLIFFMHWVPLNFLFLKLDFMFLVF